MKKIILTIMFLAFVLFFYGCTKAVTMEDIKSPVDDTDIAEDSVPGWMDIELNDVRTQTKFKISDFKGKPVLVETFAVWCPTCTKQQEKVKDLHELVGDSVVSVSLDTDPSEDEERIIDHVERNDFNWYYAVSPTGLTKQLISQFGINVVNAPSTPVILVCEDQSSRLLRFGVKDSSELMDEIAKGC